MKVDLRGRVGRWRWLCVVLTQVLGMVMACALMGQTADANVSPSNCSSYTNETVVSTQYSNYF